MTRMPQYPVVDGRRVSQLREALLRDIAALAPDWQAVGETKGPDRALVEIAARLAEEATKRLDKTPERDALAFLELFDVPPPRPNAALGVSVFALKVDKTAPVLARARTGLTIETLEGESETFETLDDLRIQPARIERLATVDPAADRLEIAPAAVTSLEPDLTPRPNYRLAASAGPAASVITIEPPVGILADDLLRVSLEGREPVFLEVSAFSDDGLATLKAPVGGRGLPAEAEIECMTRLDAFAMPDVQEHGLYIGDVHILDVKEPATITLKFSPASIAGLLSPNAVEFEIFGTREDDDGSKDAPGWHRLVPLVGGGRGCLKLYKAWTGSVDPLKLGEKEARWIRVRPHQPIIPQDGDHPLTGANATLDQVAMGIKTEKPSDIGSDTVSQAAHNGTPLPLTTSFLPFGPEPKRFDVFSLAAPEAFTKAGAIATLDFDLMKATLVTMSTASRLDDKRHVYGIGLNGRLQVIDLTDDMVLWREGGAPPEKEGSEVTLALDAEAGIAAYGWSKAPPSAVTTRDVVIARVVGGGLMAVEVEITRDPQANAEPSVKVSRWNPIPDLPDGALAEGEHPALVAVPTFEGNGGAYDALVLAASSGGLHWIRLNNDAAPASKSWCQVTSPEGERAPVLPPDTALVFVDGSIDRKLEPEKQEGAFVTADASGSLWVLQTSLDGLNQRWHLLRKTVREGDNEGDEVPIRLAEGARPAALWFIEDDRAELRVAGRPENDDNLHMWDIEVGSTGFEPAKEYPSTLAIETDATLRVVPGLNAEDDRLPHVLGYQNHLGVKQVFEWAPSTYVEKLHRPEQDALLDDESRQLNSAAIFPPVGKGDQALVAFAGGNQTLIWRKINPPPTTARATAATTADRFQMKKLASDFSAPELSWEYFNGEGWKRLDDDFRDTTDDFSRGGEISFKVPQDLRPTEIAGQQDHWIRARLVDGDYGKVVYKVVTEEGAAEGAAGSNTQTIVVDTDDLRPPEVASVTAHFCLSAEHLPKLVVARNNMRDLDQSSANRLKGAQFAMFEGAFAAPLGTGGSRAIFIGLSRPLEPGSTSLFVTAKDQPRSATLVLETLGPENTWAPAPLKDEDPTNGLHRTGLIRFNVTERPAQVLLAGRALYWLRIRVEGLNDWAPRITGVWLNGVRIVQAETIRQELLASSVGDPNLELTLLKSPVLAASLELRVRERLSEEEANELTAQMRAGEPEPVLEDVPNLAGKWVLWQQVDSLHDHPADARVYLLNPDGRLRFGDDRNGRTVPAGRDNIRAFTYQSGGQRVETAAFAEAGLTGSVEGVEMVLAPAPIAGGTHSPEPPELLARMPDVLRHGGHGLSLADLEALARDVDSEIVQVSAFPPAMPCGPVRLIVLARGASRMPTYSLAQADNLHRVLHAKMSDAWSYECLEVRSAAFVAVKVTVNLVARKGQSAALEPAAGDHLRTFLHATLGGPEMGGWPPGRGLWPTDIRRALADLEALDSVAHVAIAMPEGRALGDVRPHEVITTALARDVRVLVDREAPA